MTISIGKYVRGPKPDPQFFKALGEKNHDSACFLADAMDLGDSGDSLKGLGVYFMQSSMQKKFKSPKLKIKRFPRDCKQASVHSNACNCVLARANLQ